MSEETTLNTRRAPRGHTFDPCPGCGTVHDFQPRPKEGVCSSCREVLNAHAKAVGEAQAQGLVAVGVPEMSHWLPYIPDDPHDMRKRFHALALAVSVPSAGGVDYFDESHRLVLKPPGTNYGSDWAPYRVTDFRVMPAPVAKALRHLYEGLLQSIPGAYEKGKADGRNLLAMLSAGELTNAEFERRAGIVADR